MFVAGIDIGSIVLRSLSVSRALSGDVKFLSFHDSIRGTYVALHYLLTLIVSPGSLVRIEHLGRGKFPSFLLDSFWVVREVAGLGPEEFWVLSGIRIQHQL